MNALPQKVVVASGNSGKIREIARLLEDAGVQVVAQSEFGVRDAEETGQTFAENSLIKARHAAAATGLPAIADDSGLVVDALDGAPGVFSARYAGVGATDEMNIDKLLHALRDVALSARGAAFHCAASYVTPDGTTSLLFEGEWRGSILFGRQGDGGFGYDPVFFDPDSGKSSAMLTPDQKNARSHRGKALRGLVALIQNHYS
ncbi:MAG TPA: RdgB/HAM1 family non-canonical purine NTP pyrophosphatase [Woeseiaceae bacterium]|nr:RdgB/HAM1 family non-canonical purine NTP pyrophosphatase [Woeseiaceae bacterium]